MIGSVAFLSGCVVTAYAIIALYFFRFWRESRDVLFGCFAAAFVLLAVGRALTGSVHPAEIVYVIRLVAFVLILIAIVIKNR